MCRQVNGLLFVCVLFFISACGESIPGGGLKTDDGLKKPANFVARSQNQSNTLSWNQDSSLTYTIYWSTTPQFSIDNAQRIEDVNSPHPHKKLKNGTTYYYLIRSSLDEEFSPLSDVTSAIPTRLAALGKPVDFLVQSGNENNTLSWHRVSGAEKYRIYWTTNSEETPLLSNNQPIETTENNYLHKQLENGVKYYYVVTAAAFEGEGEATEKKWGIPRFVIPGIPANLEIRSWGEKSVTIEWSAAENATEYKVYWEQNNPDFIADEKESNFVKFLELDAGETNFILRGLVRGNKYYLRIRAVNDSGPSEPSALLEIDFTGFSSGTDTSIIPPKNIKVFVNGLVSTIRWETENEQYNYKAFYATEPNVTDENFSLLDNGTSTDILNRLSFRLNNLLVGRTYYVVIYAILGDKQSLVSKEKSFLVPIPDIRFDVADAERGGRLYARWWNDVFNPAEENPLWEDAAVDSQGNKINQASTIETWGCVQCHGWDYLGRDGEYGPGSQRFTNFPGLIDAATNKTRDEILSFIRAGKTSKKKNHSFGLMSQRDVIDLTKFIVNEVPKTMDIWGGDIVEGKKVYTEKNDFRRACNEGFCHNEQSKLISERQLLLDSALEEPGRFIHYARFGVGRMPGGPTLENAQDVLAYLWQQSLLDISSNFDQLNYDKTDSELYDQWAKGGLLYDRWWKALSSEKNPMPTGNHPLWPGQDTLLNGTDTWRCKECHGWDYLGKDGQYSKGNHFTGVQGILGSSPPIYSTPKEIYDFLRMGGQHAYTQFLSDDDIYALTRFIVEVREEANVLDPLMILDENKQEPISFSSSSGETLYHDAITFGGCVNCHTVDGFQWFFSDNDPDRMSLQTIDSIAKNSPWEFMHKIRFGHPGSNMRGIIQFQSTTQNKAIDILGYVQTALAPNIKRGGRLYDTWWKENSLDIPVTAHALWPIDPTGLIVEETWRCVSCHGWDYQGVGEIKGVTALTGDAKTFIESGTYLTADDHAFAENLKQQDIFDLSAFINDEEKKGARDDVSTLIVNANASIGKDQYLATSPGNCINCHGENGTSIANIDLEAVAKNEGFRFIHKARFGSPGSIMQPTAERFTGLSALQAADVHAYGKVISSSSLAVNAGLDRGGRLFDNWFKEMKTADVTVEDPVIVNPLWESRKIGIPDVQSLSDSWRCVSCHSWNFKGIDLLQIDSDADDLLRKVALRRIEYPNRADLSNFFYNWIKSGSGSLHNYGSLESGLPTILGDRELKDLATFITQGIIDTSEYIFNVDGKVKNSDIANGLALYTGELLTDVNCVSCHGENGESIPPGGGRALDIFGLAKTNPWKFLHNVRFATPGTEMPSLVGLPGTNLQQALDVLAYAQDEFSKRP